MKRTQLDKENIIDTIFSVEQKYTLKDMGLSSRQFSHWRKLGLFPFLKSNGDKKKVLLTYSQCFLVSFVKSLMNFGLKTEIIKTFLTNLENHHHKEAVTENIIRTISDIKYGFENSEDYVKGRIDSYIQNADMTYIQLKDLMLNMFLDRKEGGLILKFKDNELNVHSYMDGRIQQGRVLSYHHIFLSLVDVFVTLGVADIGDTQNLMTMKENHKYEEIKQLISHNDIKHIEISKHKKSTKVAVHLPTPKDKKEEQEYFKKYGPNLEFTTKNYEGKKTLSGFLYNRFLS